MKWIVFATLFVAASAAAQSSSPSYRLSQSTLNGGGGTSVSPSGSAHRLSASAGQASTIGTSSSFSYVLQSGFWSFVGSGLVPVILTGVKNGVDPTDPDWSWTGNNPPYAMHRATDCSQVSAGYLLTQPIQTWTDATPPAAPLICYSVFATAPEPIAPVGGIAPSEAGTIEER